MGQWLPWDLITQIIDKELDTIQKYTIKIFKTLVASAQNSSEDHGIFF